MVRDVYNAIIEAAKGGRGLRLSAEEVWQLSQDDAIESRALEVKLGTAIPLGCIQPPVV